MRWEVYVWIGLSALIVGAWLEALRELSRGKRALEYRSCLIDRISKCSYSKMRSGGVPVASELWDLFNAFSYTEMARGWKPIKAYFPELEARLKELGL